MEVKLIEVRDSGTTIPAIAIKLTQRSEQETFLLRRAGYAEDQIQPGYADEPYVLFGPLNGERRITYDPYDWPNRTMATSHMHMITNWNTINSGDVVDVEFIRGEKPTPKVSERVR